MTAPPAPAPPDSAPADCAPAVRRGPMLAVLLTGQAMASMDGSIVSVAAQTLREDLDADGSAIQLIVSGYLLTTGVLLVSCARLGDLLGQRRAFLLGLGWFTTASLLCGLAPDATTLVLARIAQAVGAALLTPQIFALIQQHWDATARRTAIGLYSMVLALGVALGQVLGGLIVSTDLFGLSWRPVFLLNVPIGVAVLIAGPRLLPRARPDTRARLDPAGVAVLTLAMTALTLPLIFGPGHGWPAWAWITLAAGAALLALFARHETRARHPLLDPAALRPAGVKPGLAACWLVMGAYTVFVLTLTLTSPPPSPSCSWPVRPAPCASPGGGAAPAPRTRRPPAAARTRGSSPRAATAPPPPPATPATARPAPGRRSPPRSAPAAPPGSSAPRWRTRNAPRPAPA
ncbi:MFS transporter [Nonomuraea sp. NPDC050310]|uniref:MFS transporter n=1 Tax=Nonomuraea sp. NPDC050310 TaxID=3154935 RepID=UPI0033CF4EE4